jgi:adenosine kinase
MSIICTGSLAYDYLMTFPGYFREHILAKHIDNISLSFLVDSMIRQRGGNAPNIAYTLALLGEKPLVMGTVGEDFEDYRNWLESKGIDTTYVKVIPGEYTASFFANTDLSNAQIASFYPGAMAHAAKQSILDLACKKIDLVVISPNEPKAMERFVSECRVAGIPYLYDPSQQIVRLDHDKLRYGVEGAHSLFLNEYESQLLMKHTGLTHKKILEHVQCYVITKGEEGAVIYADGNEYLVKSIKPDLIADPTGVGDAFRGGFLRGYMKDLDWVTCGQMGALAATYCLEQRGTQNHNYTIDTFISRYRQHFDDQGKMDILKQEEK